MNDFDFYWNYRVVNTKSKNGGEDWYCVREVFYDEKKKPEGHSDVSVGSESLEDVQNVLDMMSKALKLPVLQRATSTMARSGASQTSLSSCSTASTTMSGGCELKAWGLGVTSHVKKLHM